MDYVELILYACVRVRVSVNVNLSFHQVQQFHRLCNGFFCRAAVFFLCLSLQCYCRVSSFLFSTIFPIFLYRVLLSKSVLCIHFSLFKDVNHHRKQHQHQHNTSSHNTNNVHFDYFQSSSCQSTQPSAHAVIPRSFSDFLFIIKSQRKGRNVRKRAIRKIG